jgi:hypothetical protein
MRVGIIQSNFVPWRGYFDFIDSVDLFVFYDDVQYTKNDWRNRNRILSPNGLRWLTVPVHHQSLGMTIDEVPIDYGQDWVASHLGQLETCYRSAPFFHSYVNDFADIVKRMYPSISELNVALCHWVMQALSIRTPTLMSRQLCVKGKKTERLLDVLRSVGGTTYLSGPSAASYLDLWQFEREGIAVEFKSYDYAPYPQVQQGFQGEVTILDLLFNVGPKARDFLKSTSPNYPAAMPQPQRAKPHASSR